MPRFLHTIGLPNTWSPASADGRTARMSEDGDGRHRRRMLWPRVFWLLGFLAGLPSLCLAAHHGSSRHASAGVMERTGVSVEVHVLDAGQAEDIFDADLLAQHVQPVVITIRNHSAQTYRFAKSDVDAHYLPAGEAAKAAYENPVVVTGSVLGRVITAIPRWVLPHHKVTPRPLLNRSIQENFVREEIKDGEVAPNASLSGFLFLPVEENRTPLRIRLMNVQTREWLAFDVPAQPAPAD